MCCPSVRSRSLCPFFLRARADAATRVLLSFQQRVIISTLHTTPPFLSRDPMSSDSTPLPTVIQSPNPGAVGRSPLLQIDANFARMARLFPVVDVFAVTWCAQPIMRTLRQTIVSSSPLA
jgi:hypothetical protein